MAAAKRRGHRAMGAAPRRNPMTISRLVRTQREELGLTRAVVAAMAELDVDDVTMMESSPDMWCPTDWARLARALGLPFIELLIFEGFLTPEDVEQWRKWQMRQRRISEAQRAPLRKAVA